MSTRQETHLLPNGIAVKLPPADDYPSRAIDWPYLPINQLVNWADEETPMPPLRNPMGFKTVRFNRKRTPSGNCYWTTSK